MKKIIAILILFVFSLPALSECGCGETKFKAANEKISANEIAKEAFNIETKKVEEQIVDEAIRTTGQIEEIPTNHFDINSPVQGKVQSVLVTLGDFVGVGKPLVVIQSTEIARLQAEISQLKAELELAKSNYEREQTLYEKSISPKKEFEAAKAILLSQEAKLNAAESNLKILTQQDITSQGTFTIKAQKAGTIVEKKVTVGQIVVPDELLFHGIDLSSVWASADIFEKDLAKVKLGQIVSVVLDGIPDKTYEGRITYVGSVINQDSRTLPVKTTLQNKDSLLKPGAFLQFSVFTGEKKNSIIIPRTALVEVDKEGTEGKHSHIVYIKEDKKFIPRKIQVESHDSNNVEVVSGLKAGEIIVTNGAYQLQFGKKEEEHEHLKPEFNLPPYLVIIVGIVMLLIGFLFGRRKR